MTTIELHGLGVRCRVRPSGSRAAELVDAVAAAWSRCLTPTGAERDGGDVPVALLAADEPPPEGNLLRGTDLEPLMQSLTQRVTLANITAQTGHLFMLHAGAVADPASGRALACVARGGTGKTTLTRLLASDGFGYLTDETVGFTPDGRIRPYPKPLSLRRPGLDHKLERSPDSFGLGPTPADAWLHRVVLLDRRPDHTGEAALTALSTVDAIASLAPESSALSAKPRPLHAQADLLDAGPGVVRVTYAEASEVADTMRGLLQEAS